MVAKIAEMPDRIASGQAIHAASRPMRQALAENLVRDAGVCQGRQGDLLLPGRRQFQGEVSTFGFNDDAMIDDGTMCRPPGRSEFDRRGRGEDRRAREESGLLGALAPSISSRRAPALHLDQVLRAASRSLHADEVIDRRPKPPGRRVRASGRASQIGVASFLGVRQSRSPASVSSGRFPGLERGRRLGTAAPLTSRSARGLGKHGGEGAQVGGVAGVQMSRSRVTVGEPRISPIRR